MFIDIDYNKKDLKAKYYLAKPNKQVVGHIYNKSNDSLNLKLGNISEIEFSIPFKVDEPAKKATDGSSMLVHNEYIDKIKEKMLIKMTIGTEVEWFVIDNIEESSDDDTFTVKCFGLGYELKSKQVSLLEYTEATPLREIAFELLSTSIWSIGFIDTKYDKIYRTFDKSKTNVLDGLVELAETFGALIVWDTVKRKISFHDPEKYGAYRGLNLNDRLIENISQSRTSDEMVTKLYAYGADNINFSSVNPTGMTYIEDYSYFMYPFEQDEKGKVLKSSYYMSDALCKAILSYNKLVADNNSSLQYLIEQQLKYTLDISVKQSELDVLKLELDNILDRLDVAKASENKVLVNSINAEKLSKTTEINNKELELKLLKNQAEGIDKQYEDLTKSISKEANFTDALLKELTLYEIEAIFEDGDIIDPVDLLNEAKTKFALMRSPNRIVNVSTANLFNITEEQYYWDKLVLGDIVNIKKEQMKLNYRARLLEINYSFSDGEADLVISDNPELFNERSTVEEILYDAQNTSTIMNDSKWKWNEINIVSDKVSDLITSAWDATKNKINAGINNSIEIGKRGIVIRNPDRPNELLVAQSGVLAISKDKGETWETAVSAEGIHANLVMGRLLVGEGLVISSEGSTFTLDKNGARFDGRYFEVTASDGTNKVNQWDYAKTAIDQAYDDNIITPYEKKMIKIEFGDMLIQYNGLLERASGYFNPNVADVYEYKQYMEKYENMYNYLFFDAQGSGKPILDPDAMGESVFITRVEYIKVFDEFRTAEQNLITLLSERARTMIEDNQKKLVKIQEDIQDVLDDVPYWIQLTSTKGTTFSAGNIDTELIVKLFKGGDEVTAKLPTDSFVWTKRDKDGEDDIAWNTSHKNVGSKITVTRDEVFQKAIFRCEIWFDNDIAIA